VLGMSLQLEQKHNLLLAMECPVCRTLIDTGDDTAVEVKIFGAKKYGVCCNCGTEIPHPLNTCKNYRARWRRRYDKIHKKI
jgi:hypothetical protein